MLTGLQGKSIVVTGAGGGIGAAVCRRLVAEGAHVVAADLDDHAVHALADELGSDVRPVRADVTTAEGNAACVRSAVDAFGRLDAFHANAGVIDGVGRPVTEFDAAVFHKVFDVNVLGAFLGAQAALQRFAEQGGRGDLLFTASMAALTGNSGTSVYNASKHAVLGLMRCLAKETGPTVRVNALAPSLVKTPMSQSIESAYGRIHGTDAATSGASMRAALPLGRYATAEEIAAAAAWVLSDEVPYLHGETITIGGGRTP